jgi:plasmid stabilization system protein ParE
VTRSRFSVVVKPLGKAEIAEAAAWYDHQKRGLGRELTREVRAVFAHLKENPFRYQTIYEGMRRALVHHFPYGIFFEVHGSEVVVLGCIHHARDPGVWQERVTRGD